MAVDTVEDVRAPIELVSAFRTQGLKVTPQRQLPFRLLHENRGHPTAEAPYTAASEIMPGISLRTIYQTLNALAAMGELQVVSVGSGSTRASCSPASVNPAARPLTDLGATVLPHNQTQGANHEPHRHQNP